MGSVVYGTGSSNTSVHSTPDCKYLRGPQRATNPVREIPVEDLSNPSFCKGCFPEVPRIEVMKVRCQLCGQRRPFPCPHNGGVRVLIERRLDSAHYVNVRGTRGHVQPKWVWPDRAHWYTLAQPEQAG